MIQPAVCPPPLHDTIDVLQAYLTPTLAGATLFLGAALWAMTRRRLKLDLFEKRWTVYAAACAFLDAIQSEKLSEETVRRFLREKQGAAWLFDEAIASFLDEDLWNRGVEMLRRRKAGPSGVSAELCKTRARRDAGDWNQLSEGYDEINALFGPYLKIDANPWTGLLTLLESILAVPSRLLRAMASKPRRRRRPRDDDYFLDE